MLHHLTIGAALIAAICLSGFGCASTAMRKVDLGSDTNTIIRVACIGDGMTAGQGVAAGKDYPSQLNQLLGEQWNCAAFAAASLTLSDFPADLLAQIRRYQPNVAVICVGTRDVEQNYNDFSRQFQTFYTGLIHELRALESTPQIWICIPPKPQQKKLDALFQAKLIPAIRKISADDDAPIIDLYDFLGSKTLYADRWNPNAAGAALVAREVRRHLWGQSRSAGYRFGNWIQLHQSGLGDESFGPSWKKIKDGKLY